MRLGLKVTLTRGNLPMRSNMAVRPGPQALIEAVRISLLALNDSEALQQIQEALSPRQVGEGASLPRAKGFYKRILTTEPLTPAAAIPREL